MKDDQDDLGQHTSKLIREHEYTEPPLPPMSMLRLPEIEMHLWHITYRDTNKKYTGTNLFFDPRATETTRQILSEALIIAKSGNAISSNVSFWYGIYLVFQSWKRYLHRNYLEVCAYMRTGAGVQCHYRLYTASGDDVVAPTEEVFETDTFIDHIQSYILRDYDIQRLDHQPETQYIEWKNMYWMGYAYNLHVVISRGEHPTLDIVPRSIDVST